VKDDGDDEDGIEGSGFVAREAAPLYGYYLTADREAAWVNAAEFKTHCLRLIEEVRQGRGSIVVTRYGTPVARLIPYEEPPRPVVGWLRSSVLSYGDIVNPVDEPWDADT
jgi:prevent-host-death family protein